MNGRRAAVLALAVCIGAPGGGAGSSPPQSRRYETWLNREVPTLISPAEREAFQKLATDADRDLFIEEFWRQRDPTPGTTPNEFRDEHGRRLVYADEHFGGNGAPSGRLTDRGRILISLGPPLDVQKYATPDICPVEIWYYLRDLRPEGPTLVRLLFFQEYGAEEFKLYDPVADGPKRLVPFPERWKDEGAGGPPFPAEWTEADAKAYRILNAAVTGELAEASISSFPGSVAPGDAARSADLISDLEASPRRRIKDDYAAGFSGRGGAGAVDYSLHRMGNKSMAGVLEDDSGRFLVSYIVAPEILAFDCFQGRYFAGLRTRIKATDAAGQVAFQSEDFHPVELARDELKTLAQNPFELYGSFSLGPGAYALDLALENTVSKDFTSSSFKISVPGDDGPRMSPLILSRNAVRDVSGGAGRAFRTGTIQLYPSVDGAFMSKDVLFIFLQVDGLGPESARGATVEYSILSGGKAQRTLRRPLPEAPGRRDLLEEFAIEDFAPGSYAVKAALLDKDGREVLSRTAELTVTAKFVRGPWVFSAI